MVSDPTRVAIVTHRKKDHVMSYAIIGSGTVGGTLARLFARADVPASITNTRGPGSIDLGDAVRKVVTPVELTAALAADVIIAALPFTAVPALGGALPTWSGRIVVDVTNAFGVDPATFGGKSSAEFNAGFFPGGKLVRALNHLPYTVFERDTEGAGRRTVFVSGDDEAANAIVSDLSTALGFAPVDLGPLAVGGPLLRVGGPLLMKNLVEYPI
jgi:predicted dinucleotide-binding enzyme